jgi:D-alanyl-D-alanine endopeptidase (penicillin-binding protein 7)
MRNFLRIGTAFLGLLASNAYANIQTTAKSYLVVDLDNNKVIASKNTEDRRSIASVTKLMTAIVALDAKPDLKEPVKVVRLKGATSRIPSGMKFITRDELLNLAIVKSDNLAAALLCYYYPGGSEACIRAMNDKASDLMLPNTSFVDPTGIYAENKSTATELSILVLISEGYPEIVAASQKSVYTIATRKQKLNYTNTNPLVANYSNIEVSKTGWIGAASGGCLVMLVTHNLTRYAVILLGSKNTQTRIAEARQILDKSLL